VRRTGGGRKRVAASDPGLVAALKRLVEPVTRGDPVRPLIWASKSMDKLAEALTAMGHPISADTVRSELTKLGFSRQHNRKADEGARHPDRNAQFEYINGKVEAAQAAGQPVISVDTKKKELVGNYKNAGSAPAYAKRGKVRPIKANGQRAGSHPLVAFKTSQAPDRSARLSSLWKSWKSAGSVQATPHCAACRVWAKA
jgi:Rhodopirellula transposase DDE domain